MQLLLALPDIAVCSGIPRWEPYAAAACCTVRPQKCLRASALRSSAFSEQSFSLTCAFKRKAVDLQSW